MENNVKKVYLGFINFGALTAPYLSSFLASLQMQTFKDFKIISYDNTPANETSYLENLPVTIDVYKTSENIGFSRAYNKLISEAAIARAKYFLIINPDTYLKPDALELLVKALDDDETLGSVCPKLLRWDFRNNQLTNIIDSCGLGKTSGFNFFDYGQGEVDNGQYDKQIIFGPGGAAGLWRIDALNKIAEHGQYFDENFFMYKEDCDLAYRAFLAGLKTRLVSEALIYHDRTSAAGTLIKRFFNRFKRSKKIRAWSFVNQHWLIIKYWQRQNVFIKLSAIGRLVIMFLEALLIEPYLLKCYRTIFSQAKNLKRY